MRPLLVCLLLFAGNYLLKAQDSFVRIKPGENAAKIMAKEIYVYPEFTQGNAIFRDGKVNSGKLNYNMLVNEMHFINENGDTLSLTNEKTLRYLAIGADTFYYDNFFLQQLASGESLKLLRRRRIKIADKQKIGAYDQPTSNSAINSYSTFSDGLRMYNLNVREEVIMNKQTLYFFGDKYNSFLPATRKSLLKFFGKNHQLIENYLDNNHPDFNNEQDLLKMVQVLNKG